MMTQKITYPYNWNRLEVLERLKTGEEKNSHYSVKAKCFCGNIFICKEGQIRSGRKWNCGCTDLRGEANRLRTTHGKSHSQVYHSYHSMRYRCYNTKDKAYKNYGGRGITVSNEWMTGVQAFILDMEESYFEGAELDRIDNNGNYCKENCRWVTTKDNGRNRRDTVYVEGIKLAHIKEVATSFGMGYSTMPRRLQTRGQNLQQMLSFPVKGYEAIWPAFVEEINKLLREKEKLIKGVGI